MEFISPCHFGLEKVLKNEILDLGYEVTRVEDGKVFYRGPASLCARANLNLRTTERVLLHIASFTAKTFDELFEAVRVLPWEDYIPKDGKTWVAKANSVRSALFSPSDIQSIVKKAISERLKEKYGLSWLPETGEKYPLRISILKDVVTIGLDTSGESLHKRGYRTDNVIAPITETLAAALLMLTPFRKGRILADPFCGSGTFLIEGAMIAGNRAPGLNRSFSAEKWTHLFPKRDFFEAREEARDRETEIPADLLFGSDISPEAIRFSKENAKRAGVSGIRFQTAPVSDFTSGEPFGFLVTNPPYGERISEKAELPALYDALGTVYRKLDSWSLYVITPYEGLEESIGRPADKNRKIYNGMMKTYFYSYAGPKPPKKNEENQ